MFGKITLKTFEIGALSTNAKVLGDAYREKVPLKIYAIALRLGPSPAQRAVEPGLRAAGSKSHSHKGHAPTPEPPGADPTSGEQIHWP